MLFNKWEAEYEALRCYGTLQKEKSHVPNVLLAAVTMWHVHPGGRSLSSYETSSFVNIGRLQVM